MSAGVASDVMPVGTRKACATAFLMCIALLWPLVFGDLSVFDEGFVVSGAMMMRRGWLPLVDFYVIYGPGQFAALAALYELFGENLAVSRLLHLATLGALGSAVAFTTIMLVGLRPLQVLVATLAFTAMAAFVGVSPSYPALPAALLLLCSISGYRRWVVAGSLRALAGASLWAGCAGLFRWDFGVFGLCAQAIAVYSVGMNNRTTRAYSTSEVAAVVAPGLALMLAGFVPLVIASGWRQWIEEVPRYALFEFNRWRGIPFVRPELRSLALSVLSGTLHDVPGTVVRLLFATIPFVLVTATLYLAVRRRLAGAEKPTVECAVALLIALISLGLLNQMRVRPGLAQVMPAYVVSLPLLMYLLGHLRSSSVDRPLRGHTNVIAVALVLCILPACSIERQYLWSDDIVRQSIPLPRSAIVRGREPERSSTYAAMVAHICAHTAPNEPIFSGVADTSRLFVNDAILYFIADRPPATRWIEMEPGITNTDAGQRALIGDLERSATKVVVLWTMTSNEPNASGRSNGVHLLDDHIRRHFGLSLRFGRYEVLLRNSAGASDVK